jgi:hypothetical protein
MRGTQGGALVSVKASSVDAVIPAFEVRGGVMTPFVVDFEAGAPDNLWDRIIREANDSEIVGAVPSSRSAGEALIRTWVAARLRFFVDAGALWRSPVASSEWLFSNRSG